MLQAAQQKCTYCKFIASNFLKGIHRTSTGEFSTGSKGWTLDNEKFMGKFTLVESRFEEIMNGVCNITYKNYEAWAGPLGSLMQKRDPKCLMRVEDMEDVLTAWWIKKHKKIIEKKTRRLKGTVSFSDLHSHLCHDTMMHCCAKGML